jgi:hypothetical protein
VPESDSPNNALDCWHPADPTIALHISLDVKRVLRRLPPHLQYLAEILCDFSETGKSRSGIYQMILEIRAAFSECEWITMLEGVHAV